MRRYLSRSKSGVVVSNLCPLNYVLEIMQAIDRNVGHLFRTGSIKRETTKEANKYIHPIHVLRKPCIHVSGNTKCIGTCFVIFLYRSDLGRVLDIFINILHTKCTFSTSKIRLKWLTEMSCCPLVSAFNCDFSLCPPKRLLIYLITPRAAAQAAHSGNSINRVRRGKTTMLARVFCSRKG